MRLSVLNGCAGGFSLRSGVSTFRRTAQKKGKAKGREQGVLLRCFTPGPHKGYIQVYVFGGLVIPKTDYLIYELRLTIDDFF